MAESVVSSANLETDMDRYRQMGYRLDMIVPADSPSEAILSKNGEAVRLVSSSSFTWPDDDNEPTEAGTQTLWVTGRAGMAYRDLIPDRLGGRVIASHIRLTNDGEVPDYVHYHKVDFQMIYCKRGRIKVVYEDQGPPFWFETGDCVLQPPEIRHRVLECTAAAEVIEISMPAVHETWVEHEMELPTRDIKPERIFGGQRFVRHVATDAKWQHNGDVEFRDTGISAATDGFADVKILRMNSGKASIPATPDTLVSFCFVLAGHLTLRGNSRTFAAGDGFTLSGDDDLRASAGTELVYVSIKV